MKNTLVALPTGLGKTFIAAVVMYNFYRWFPTGKIVFLAPTKPLVAQQLEATLDIVEISPTETIELTGGQSPVQRQAAWSEQRVFFSTPQVIQNDLISGICDASKLVMIVFDEAHRALGNHAYCDTIRLISSKVPNISQIRILALTATPASNVKTVQQLIDNLLISHIAIRREDSPDVLPYIHGRTLKTVVVNESAEIKFIRESFEKSVLQPYIDKLVQMGALHIRDPMHLSSFVLMQSRDKIRLRNTLPPYLKGSAEGIFAIMISLYHAYELLLLHGIFVFKNHLTKLPEENGSLQTRIRHELDSNAAFAQLMSYIDTQSNLPNFVSHPKITILEKTLLDHFNRPDSAQTRAIVFSQYRESVFEILSKLSMHSPLLKVMSFVGKALTGKEHQQVTQKQQLEVLEKFRSGGYNVLVATCIGEEGLDIGNVDLIICFDMQSSPIRMLQRIGRTGRHREGNIVLLLGQGKEEERYKRTLTQHRTVQKAIENAAKNFVFFQEKDSILPKPTSCVERRFVIVQRENVTTSTVKNTSGKKRKLQNAPSLSVSDALIESVPAPVPFEYPSWHKNLGVCFGISHSDSTKRFCGLLKEFEEIDDSLLELEISVFPNRKGKTDNCSPDIPKTGSEQLEIELQQEIAKMKRNVSINFIPWSDHMKNFSQVMDSLIPRNSKDLPQPCENNIEIKFDLESVPDDFFEDSNVSTSESSTNSNTALILSPLKRMNLNPACDHSTVAQVDSSQGIFRAPHRRMAIAVDSSFKERTPVKPDIDRGRITYTRTSGRSKFIDYEAGGDSSDKEETDTESITSSLAAFIDDSIGSDETIATNSINNDEEEVYSQAPSSEGMMAFYQRTAYQSQPHPEFRTAPRQFGAQKTKLQIIEEFSMESTTSSSEKSHPINNLEDINVGDLDWLSDNQEFDP